MLKPTVTDEIVSAFATNDIPGTPSIHRGKLRWLTQMGVFGALTAAFIATGLCRRSKTSNSSTPNLAFNRGVGSVEGRPLSRPGIGAKT